MPRFSDMTNRWDQWALMRCPLLWQLRLHWYLPLALLWCVLVLGIWMQWMAEPARWMGSLPGVASTAQDRKSTRLNSSHSQISYAVFCLKKKNHANLTSNFHERFTLTVEKLLHSCTLKRGKSKAAPPQP